MCGVGRLSATMSALFSAIEIKLDIAVHGGPAPPPTLSLIRGIPRSRPQHLLLQLSSLLFFAFDRVVTDLSLLHLLPFSATIHSIISSALRNENLAWDCELTGGSGTQLLVRGA